MWLNMFYKPSSCRVLLLALLMSDQAPALATLQKSAVCQCRQRETMKRSQQVCVIESWRQIEITTMLTMTHSTGWIRQRLQHYNTHEINKLDVNIKIIITRKLPLHWVCVGCSQLTTWRTWRDRRGQSTGNDHRRLGRLGTTWRTANVTMLRSCTRRRFWVKHGVVE